DRQALAARRLDLAYLAWWDSELAGHRRARGLQLARRLVERFDAEDQDRLTLEVGGQQDRRARCRTEHRNARAEALDCEHDLGAERCLEPLEVARRVGA